MDDIKIFPLGLDALTIEFGNEISEKLNRRAVNLARYLEKKSFSGFIETVPAYASVTVFYDFYKVRNSFAEFPTAFEAVKNLVEKVLESDSEISETENRQIEIPVVFDNESALDLEFIADFNNLTKEETIEIFTSQIYRVFMLGFLPGFAYLGEIDERISVPRRSSPRVQVPKGSVGIAGRQTGIYPLASPGGWQIIGRTNTEMFDARKENPSLLEVGDLVKFYESSL